MQRLTKEYSISKISCAIATSIALNTIGADLWLSERANAAALTLQEATEAELSFSGFYGIPEQFSVLFTAVGSMKYSSTPLKGTFFFLPSDFLFLEDPTDLPEDSFPIGSFSLTADQGYRLVTELNFVFPTSAYSYTSDLTSGSSFRAVFLFRPTSTATFPPGDGALLYVSSGDPRRPGLVTLDSWFLGTPSGGDRQLLISSGGGFFGFDNSPSSSTSIVWLDGTWKATAVPEPFSVLGTAAALMGGTYLKRRQVR